MRGERIRHVRNTAFHCFISSRPLISQHLRLMRRLRRLAASVPDAACGAGLNQAWKRRTKDVAARSRTRPLL